MKEKLLLFQCATRCCFVVFFFFFIQTKILPLPRMRLVLIWWRLGIHMQYAYREVALAARHCTLNSRARHFLFLYFYNEMMICAYMHFVYCIYAFIGTLDIVFWLCQDSSYHITMIYPTWTNIAAYFVEYYSFYMFNFVSAVYTYRTMLPKKTHSSKRSWKLVCRRIYKDFQLS